MNILDTVLRHCAPMDWEETTSSDYDNVRYKLYDVNVGEREYMTEVNAFFNGAPRVEVNRLQRVQNPFQLGRFILRKEQKRFRRENLNVVKYYHPLRKIDLEVALEHNMDVRRYTSQQSGQVCGKNPKFYKTPGQAFSAITNCEVILICDVLGRSSDGSTTYKENDTEYYPTYVVTIN